MKFKNKKLRLSFSSMSTYEHCPYKYKLKYIDRIETDIRFPYLEKGQKIHAEIEHFYKTLARKEKITIQDIEEHRKVFDKEVYSDWKSHFDSFLELNKNILKNLNGNGKYFYPLSVEEKLYDEDLDIVGVIDAVYYDGKNLLILDFKTGKPRPSLTSSDRRQLSIYTHLWNLFHPDKRATHWGHFYTQKKVSRNNPLIEKVKEQTIKLTYEKIKQIRKKILLGNFQRRKSAWTCGRCEYLEYCYGDK